MEKANVFCFFTLLQTGDYEVGVRRNSDVPTDITATLRVFEGELSTTRVIFSSVVINRSSDL